MTYSLLSLLFLSMLSPSISFAKTAYEEAFDKSLNYENDCEGSINPRGAEYIANAVSAGQLDLKVFLKLYDKVCDFNQSVRIANDVKNKKSDLNAFFKAFKYEDSCENHMKADDAEIIAAGAAKQRFNTKDVLEVYEKICEVDTAISLATDAKAGELSLPVFFKAYNAKGDCDPDRYINAAGAEIIARGAAAGEYDYKVVLNKYRKSCDFDRSIRIAKNIQQGGPSNTGSDDYDTAPAN